MILVALISVVSLYSTTLSATENVLDNSLSDLISMLHKKRGLNDVTIVFSDIIFPAYNQLSMFLPSAAKLVEIWKLGLKLSLINSQTFQQIIKDKKSLTADYLFFVNETTVMVLLNQIFTSSSSDITQSQMSIFVVLNDFKEIRRTFDGIYIPFTRQVYVIVNELMYEVYHLNGNTPLVVSMLPAEQSIPDKSKYIWQRRRDLQQMHFGAATEEDSPLSLLEGSSENLQVYGYIPDLWHVLEQILNFTTSYQRSVDGLWGEQGENGSWTGMIGMLQRHEVDVAVTDLTNNPARQEIVDFTIPIYSSSYRLYFRQPNELVTPLAFLLPFSWDLWSAVLFAILSLPIIILIILHLYQKFLPTTSGVPASNSFVLIFGAFCQQGTSNIPGPISARLVIWISFFIALVVYNVYSAVLISRLAITKWNYPFNTLTELLQNNEYNLGIEDGTVFIDSLQDSQDGLLQEMWRKISQNENNIALNVKEGLEKACRSNYVFLSTYVETDHKPYKTSCKLDSIIIDSWKDRASIAVTKEFPYRHLLDYYLRKMQETGHLQRFLVKWLRKVENPVNKIRTLELRNVLACFLILGIGTLFSIVILLIEHQIHKYNIRRLMCVTNMYMK